MTFLNPLVLFGLAAAAIPILIHLLNLRKLKVVEFSSLRFLKELQKTRMRRLKLKQWLILLLRTLLIVFLVLAFSRPALKGTFAAPGSGHAASTLVILLDDSPSMGTRNDRGVLFEQAKEAAAQLLGTVGATDEVFLFRLSDNFEASAAPLPISAATALKALPGMSVSQRTLPFTSLVGRGIRTLAASRNANRELVLITDAQGTGFSLADTAVLAGLPAVPDVRAFFIELSPTHRENCAVTSLTVESRLLSQAQPLLIRGIVTNYGNRQAGNTLVSLYFDGTRVAQQSVTVAPRASAAVLMTAAPKRRGIIGTSLRIDGDILDLDNNRFLVIRIPERISVTFIGSAAADTHYPALALRAAMDSARGDAFAIQETTRDRLQFTDISAQDVLVVCNPQGLTAAGTGRIVASVISGRSLMLFPGKETDYGEVNSGLLQPLGIPPIAPPELRPPASESTGFLSFRSVDYSHPVFEGMFARTSGGRMASPEVESPRIQTAVGLRAGTTGMPVITMSDGRPFLCEYRAGKGKAFVFAVESGITWSDFPFKGMFAPLVHRSVVYLATQEQPPETTRVGEPLSFTVRLSGESTARGYVVLSPSGNEERVQPEQRASSGVTIFQTEPVRETGIHVLVPEDGSGSRGRPLQALAVNSVVQESDLARVEDDKFDAFWGRLGIPASSIRTIDSPGEITRAVRESRYGVELWRYCLVLALVCALVEMVLSRAGTPAAGKEAYAHDSK